MEFYNLEKTNLRTIHSAFIDAFSEYEVKIDMPMEKLAEMMKARSYNPKFSVGCFMSGALIGFVLSGYREIGGQKRCYDIATGVIKEYQNKKIGSLLVQGLQDLLDREKIDQFQLEVLEHNRAAQQLYIKSGFTISRRLHCYTKTIGQRPQKHIPYTVYTDTDLPTDIDETAYVSFVPSWQNALASYYNNRDRYQLKIFQNEKKIAGYGIVHKTEASVLQLGISPEYRAQGLEETIIASLAKATGATKLRFLNIEADSYMDTRMKEMEFENDINQYEMIYLNRNFSSAQTEPTSCPPTRPLYEHNAR